MTKAELVTKIANETGLTKLLAEKAVDSFVSTVSSALALRATQNPPPMATSKSPTKRA